MTQALARLAASPRFDAAIMVVIVVNAVVLGLETYDEIDRRHGGTLETVNDICLAIFVGELAIRVGGAGWRPDRFFRNGWNAFDFVVIAAAFVPGARSNTTLLRLLRLARIIRIVRLLPDMRVLVVAIGRSIPGVLSLMAIAVLMLYVYGMVGWMIFDDHDPDQYGTIGRAMLTLFVLLSLEGLPEAVDMGMKLSGWTVLYFISFVLVASFLLLNILIGIVINSMEEAREMEWQREQDEQRRRAGLGPATVTDHDLAVVERLAELRRAMHELEHELRATATAHRGG